MIEQITDNSRAIIRLNRPEVKNAFNPKMIGEITKAFQSFGPISDVRCVMIEAAGPVFCAGADLNWMQSLVETDFHHNQKDAELLHGMFQAIWDCPVPVVCKVQGSAFGGALGLMACSDYVIAEENVKMSFSEVKLGIAPSVISEFVMRKNIPSIVASWMMSGHLFTAHEAYHSGLVHKVVKTDEMSDVAEKYIKSVCDSGPEAVRATKKLIRDLEGTESSKVRDLTTALIARLRVSDEGQEGIKSFLEKRKPNWIKK